MMADFRVFPCLLFLVFCQVIFSLPFDQSGVKVVSAPDRKFRMFFPKYTNLRERRAEGEGGEGAAGESGDSGFQQFQEFLTTAIKDGIAASSAFQSPTMFIGGFSVMMQPMPNGTEFAGQLMQMAPHYMGLLPGAGGK